MTREEIMAMEAGREMDKLVANKIMGLPIGWTHAKLYSSDISAAWEVVVKMENDDYWWMADDVVPNSDPVVYHWKFYKGKNQYHSDYEYSISLAICRAALLAVMEGDQKYHDP